MNYYPAFCIVKTQGSFINCSNILKRRLMLNFGLKYFQHLIQLLLCSKLNNKREREGTDYA